MIRHCEHEARGNPFPLSMYNQRSFAGVRIPTVALLPRNDPSFGQTTVKNTPSPADSVSLSVSPEWNVLILPPCQSVSVLFAGTL